MANITIELKDEVLEGIVAHHGYQEKMNVVKGNPEIDGVLVPRIFEEIKNPQSKEEFITEKVRNYLKESYVSYRAITAAEEARTQAIAEAEVEFDK